MSQFAHLHLHSQYSLLDGVNKVSEVVYHAQKLGQPAIAITDHGNMHGAVEFYDSAMKAGIKPIIGCELYINSVSRFERKTKHQGGAGNNHLTVLAKNMKGYQNLCKLVTRAYREGFYFKPRIDHEILQEYSEGLVVMSGCLAGELNSFVENDNFEDSKRIIEFYAKTFGEDYYLEIQPHPIAEQRRLNTACIDLAKDLGVPLVATTDCHYPCEGHHFAQEVLMCISTGKTVHDPSRIKHDGVKLHLKTAEEMYEEFGDQPCDEAIKNLSLIHI